MTVIVGCVFVIKGLFTKLLLLLLSPLHQASNRGWRTSQRINPASSPAPPKEVQDFYDLYHGLTSSVLDATDTSWWKFAFERLIKTLTSKPQLLSVLAIVSVSHDSNRFREELVVLKMSSSVSELNQTHSGSWKWWSWTTTRKETAGLNKLLIDFQWLSD